MRQKNIGMEIFQYLSNTGRRIVQYFWIKMDISVVIWITLADCEDSKTCQKIDRIPH